MQTTDDARAKFLTIIKKFDTAMLVSIGLTGELISRPMAVAGIDPDDTVYFFSSWNTEKVQEINDDSHVVLAFMDGWKMASLSGRGTVIRDRAKIDELWKESYKSWFPKGQNDPQLCIIQVEPVEGEFWDSSGIESFRYIFQAAKAYVTGTTPQVKEGEQHGKVNF